MAQLIHHIRQAFEGGNFTTTGRRGGSNTIDGDDASSLLPARRLFFSSSTTTTTTTTFGNNLMVVFSCVIFYKCLIELSCYVRIRHHKLEMSNLVSDLMSASSATTAAGAVPSSSDPSTHTGGAGGRGGGGDTAAMMIASNSETLRSSNGRSRRRQNGGGGGGSNGGNRKPAAAANSRVRIDLYTRSLLHVGLSSTVMFWPYLDITDGWSWKLIALLPAVVMARCFYKALWVRDSQDEDVQNMSLTNSPTDLLLGPTFHAGVMIWLTLRHFMTVEAAVIAAATLGDGIAPIVGERFGRHIYRFPWSKRMTVEGSVVGVLLGTVVGCYYYLYMMGLPLLPLRMILMYATIATVAESSSIAVMDNIIVPVMLHVCMDPVQMWL